MLKIIDKTTYMNKRTNALIIAQFRIHYDQYSTMFSYFVKFFKITNKYRKGGKYWLCCKW